MSCTPLLVGLCLLLVYAICVTIKLVSFLRGRGSGFDGSAPWAIQFKKINIVGKSIGQGNFAKVYKGTYRGKEVAVKKLLIKTMANEIRRQFEAEVGIMNLLRHPNLVMFIGASVVPPNFCIITEFCSNGSLYEFLRVKGVVKWESRIKILTDAALGVNYLHGFRPTIVHNDMKSPNILLDDNINAKISDFGLSATYSAESNKSKAQKKKSVAKSPIWAAPELYLDERRTEMVDVYSFGVVVWECVTRKLPFLHLPTESVPVQVALFGLRPEIGSLAQAAGPDQLGLEVVE